MYGAAIASWYTWLLASRVLLDLNFFSSYMYLYQTTEKSEAKVQPEATR